MASDGTIARFVPPKHIEKTKKEWLRKQEVYRKMYYAKSSLPPMNIEPFRNERERLPFRMTPEDRALRQQWLRDQILSPKEPIYVPQLIQRNAIRRAYGYPWDLVTKMIQPVVGLERARAFRYLVPKYMMLFAGIGFLVNYFQHNTSSWEKKQGFNTYVNRLQTYPGEAPPENPSRDFREKHCGEFYDQGFSRRTSHLSLAA